MSVIAKIVIGVLLITAAQTVLAWGDEGHEIIGSVAEHFMTARAKKSVEALLAGDMSGLTRSTDIPEESTWADRYRESDRYGSKRRYYRTREWHFADIEIDGGALSEACHHFPALPSGVWASEGPPHDCVVNKLLEFTKELRSPDTPIEERRIALLFVLHLVGDLHQPLHVSDNDDYGGNEVKVSDHGRAVESLHHLWDVEFVREISPDEHIAARALISAISAAELRRWQSGTIEDWANESHDIGVNVAYGELDSTDRHRRHELSDQYDIDALRMTQLQLSRAGVRLAYILNSIF